MKKKFYGALVLGSVLLAGGMVSCSDYDDDIDSLNNRVTAVEQTVKELQDKINAGSVITSVDPTENGVKVTLSNGESFELQNGAPGAAATIEIGSNGNWFINGVDTGKPSKGDKGDPGDPGKDGTSATGKYYKPGENGYWIEVIVGTDGKETETETTISWTPEGTMTAAWDSENGKLMVSNVKGYNGILTINLTSELKSLVFVPEFYYEGIEAMEARTFNYTEKTVQEVEANKDYSTDAPIEKDGVAMSPGVVAEYHMNPSSANWKDIKSLSYLTADKNYTRANGTVSANVFDWEGKDGILTVHSQLTDGTIKDISKGQVTVLALQANYSGSEKDTIITSDYAAVKATDYNIVALAHSSVNGATGHTEHLYTTAEEAIKNAASHEIVYNHTGLDVATLVQTHYTTPTEKDVEWDKNATVGEVEKYGFKYSFELVGYHVGDNNTSESAHAVMQGSLLKPCMPVNGQQPTWDAATQNKAEKGREPLVRVILTDTISNKIAAVGYLKFKIVEKATPVQSEVIFVTEPPFEFNKNYTVDCSEAETTLKIEWHDFEEDILAKLLEKQGISKEEFHNKFKLEGGDTNATQYDGVEATSQPTTKKGIVAQTTTDTGNEETQVITWTLKNNEAYQLFKNNASISVNIRYSKEVTAGVYQYVYITLTWTPEDRNVQPSGTINNTDKIKNYWYAYNVATPGQGVYDEIHANVETVGEEYTNPDGRKTEAKDNFKSDILNTFEGNDVTVSVNDAETYTAFTDTLLKKTFTFVDPQDSKMTPVKGNSGTMYDITVSAEGKTLNANVVGNPLVIQPVVVLNGSVLEYQGKDDNTNYSFARDILNAADHAQFTADLEGKKTFTAQIQINAENCDYVPFDLSNNTFFAKFLRPITISDTHETNFVDATTGGATADLKLSFTDWRDHNFDDATVTKGQNYYEYYDVESIEQKGDILTDLNGQEGVFDRKLSDVTGNVKFTFKAPTEAEIQNAQNHYFGTLTYLNNGTTVGNFKIKVPFDVTYDWGTIRVWVICNISQTEAN